MKQQLKRQLVVDVTYEVDTDESQVTPSLCRQLHRQLKAAAEHLYDQGLLSGDLPVAAVKYRGTVLELAHGNRSPLKSGGYAGIRYVLSGTGALKGNVVGSRQCQLSGCGGLQLCVRWPDGKRTWCCTKGLHMPGKSKDTLQINS